jgi:Ankyrin repeats (3 copies)
MSAMNMQTMEQRIDPDNDVNIFLTAFIFMTQNGFHKKANPLVGLCITTWVEHQMWDSPLKDMGHGRDKRTRLMHAAWVGNVNRVKWLLRRGASVDKADKWGWTALHFASSHGHLEVVRELLVGGADVNKANNDGWASLMWAGNSSRLEVVRELLAHGADVNKVDTYGGTALSRANLPAIRELLQRSSGALPQSRGRPPEARSPDA